jgi:hypothetical protein
VPPPPQSDLFLCHASEDKDAVAAPIEQRLSEAGVRVWFDRRRIHLGDSIRVKIDEGLAHCRFAMVVLSRSFPKFWTGKELDGIFARQEAEKRTFILPVWHGVTKSFVTTQWPTLANLRAANTEQGIDTVVQDVLTIMVQDGVLNVEQTLAKLGQTFAAPLASDGDEHRRRSVAGRYWENLDREFERIAQWVDRKFQKGRWSELHRHLKWAMVQDLYDIQTLDWPSVREDIARFLEGRAS